MQVFLLQQHCSTEVMGNDIFSTAAFMMNPDVWPAEHWLAGEWVEAAQELVAVATVLH